MALEMFELGPQTLNEVSILNFTGLHHGPSLWVGTNSGYIYPYTIELPPDDQRRTNNVLAHPKKPEIHLKHNAPVITLFVVDKDGNPIGEDHLVESGKKKGMTIIMKIR